MFILLSVLGIYFASMITTILIGRYEENWNDKQDMLGYAFVPILNTLIMLLIPIVYICTTKTTRNFSRKFDEWYQNKPKTKQEVFQAELKKIKK